jgi:hypothetical protein
MVVVQFLTLVVFAWFNRVAWIRILVLRQQFAVYKRKSKQPLLRNRDRLFWSFLSKVGRDWTSELILVRPETVIRWRKRKFREFWRTMSQGRSGRPPISSAHIAFIRRISSDHPEYGEDRIALELAVKFGIRHASSTVRRYMVKLRPGPTDSQECLDRMLIWNERHLRWVLTEFIGWYNHRRVHQGLNGIPDPDPALADPKPLGGRLVATPVLNGLHHDYRLAA